MMNKIKTISILIIVYSLTFMNIAKADEEISLWERRKLMQFPEITFEEIFSGKWFLDYEKYSLDQMIFRNQFRQLKLWFEESVLKKQDVSGLFSDKGYIFKKVDYKNVEDLDKFVNYIHSIKGDYFANINIHFALIPDKGFFSERKDIIESELETLEYLQENFTEFNFIDLFNFLELEDYYKTDTHWKQDKIHDVVEAIIEGMDYNINYKKNEFNINIYKDFLGVLYGQFPIKAEKESLVYLDHPDFSKFDIYDYEKGPKSIYDEDKLDNMDSYDVFLSGASPILEINNPTVDNNEELIVFRDSFGSSILPLLSLQYKKIIAVDTRYVPAEFLEDYINFSEKQDVLFLYSTSIIHNYETLR